MPVRRGWLVFWAVFTLWPLLPALLGILLATLLGCPVNLNALEPCSVNGSNWGVALSNLYGCGWLLLGSVPLGGLAAVVWAVWMGVRASRRED